MAIVKIEQKSMVHLKINYNWMQDIRGAYFLPTILHVTFYIINFFDFYRRLYIPTSSWVLLAIHLISYHDRRANLKKID